jgi:hypothetical protein
VNWTQTLSFGASVLSVSPPLRTRAATSRYLFTIIGCVKNSRIRYSKAKSSRATQRYRVQAHRPLGLCEKPVDGEIVARHSDAFLRAMAERLDRVRSDYSGSDVVESSALDGYPCMNIKNAGAGAQGKRYLFARHFRHVPQARN